MTEAELDVLDEAPPAVKGDDVIVLQEPLRSSTCDPSSSRKRGIMKVRTLDESLKGSNSTNTKTGAGRSVYVNSSQIAEEIPASAPHDNHRDDELMKKVYKTKVVGGGEGKDVTRKPESASDTESMTHHNDESSVFTGPSAVHDDEEEDDGRDMMRASTRSIQFDSCIVREYDVALGDNPCVRNGAPLSLGWKYVHSGSVSVEEYENIRPSEDRRVSGELVMPRHVRERLMMEWGHSRSDMRDAVREVNQTKHMRLKTVNNLTWMKFEEGCESLRRKFKGLMNPKKRREEKKAMKEALKQSKEWRESYKTDGEGMDENERRAEAAEFIRKENEAASIAQSRKKEKKKQKA